MVLKIGMSDSTKEYRITIFQLLNTVIRHHLAMIEVVLRAPVIARELELDAMRRRRGIQHLQSLVYHIHAYPVAPDYRYLIL